MPGVDSRTALEFVDKRQVSPEIREDIWAHSSAIDGPGYRELVADRDVRSPRIWVAGSRTGTDSVLSASCQHATQLNGSGGRRRVLRGQGKHVRGYLLAHLGSPRNYDPRAP